MKRPVIFIIFLLVSVPAFSQTKDFWMRNSNKNLEFFMPQNEMRPRYEKLPPIVNPVQYEPNTAIPLDFEQNSEMESSLPVKRVKRYIAVDGRYIPVFEDISELGEIQDFENIDEGEDEGSYVEEVPPQLETKIVEMPVIVEDTVTGAENYNQSEISTLKQTTPTITALVETDNSALPAYRRAYAKYLQDLHIFRSSKSFPYDEALDKVLQKMNSDNKIVIFEGSVQ